MIYFIDTEFIEDGRTIDLVSIGIAAMDGRTYYVISTEFNPTLASDWVKENVLRKLASPFSSKSPWKSRAQIHDDILAFVGNDSPEFWGYYADYDWVAFCQLFGRMIDLPRGFPMYCRDLKQVIDQRKLGEIPFNPDDEHFALSDAVWNRRVYAWIKEKLEP